MKLRQPAHSPLAGPDRPDHSDPAFSADPLSHPYHDIAWSVSLPAGHPVIGQRPITTAPDSEFQLIQPPNSPTSDIATSPRFPFPLSRAPEPLTTASTSNPPVAVPSRFMTKPQPPAKQERKFRMPFRVLTRRKTTQLQHTNLIENPKPNLSLPKNDVTHQAPRPAAQLRRASEPIIPQNIESPAFPPRVATTGTDTPRSTAPSSTASVVSKRLVEGLSGRVRDLDRIDELDETSPWGISLHHGGPYEAAVQAIRRSDRRVPLGILNAGGAASEYHRQAMLAHGNVYIPPQVPTGVSLKLSPGQILPRSFKDQLGIVRPPRLKNSKSQREPLVNLPQDPQLQLLSTTSSIANHRPSNQVETRSLQPESLTSRRHTQPCPPSSSQSTIVVEPRPYGHSGSLSSQVSVSSPFPKTRPTLSNDTRPNTVTIAHNQWRSVTPPSALPHPTPSVQNQPRNLAPNPALEKISSPFPNPHLALTNDSSPNPVTDTRISHNQCPNVTPPSALPHPAPSVETHPVNLAPNPELEKPFDESSFSIGMAMLEPELPEVEVTVISPPNIYLQTEMADDVQDFDPYDAIHSENEYARTAPPLGPIPRERSHEPSPDPRHQAADQEVQSPDKPHESLTVHLQRPFSQPPPYPGHPDPTPESEIRHQPQPPSQVHQSSGNSQSQSRNHTPEPTPSMKSNGPARSDESGHSNHGFEAARDKSPSENPSVIQPQKESSSQDRLSMLHREHSRVQPRPLAPSNRDRERDGRSTHQSINTYSSSQSRNHLQAPPHRHLPKRLVMPAPLNNNGALPPSQRRIYQPPPAASRFPPRQMQMQFRTEPQIYHSPSTPLSLPPILGNAGPLEPQVTASRKLKKRVSVMAPSTNSTPPIVATVSFAPPVIGFQPKEKILMHSKSEKVPKRVLSKRFN